MNNKTFRNKILNHLISYKNNVLNLKENWVYDNKNNEIEYGHILNISDKY